MHNSNKKHEIQAKRTEKKASEREKNKAENIIQLMVLWADVCRSRCIECSGFGALLHWHHVIKNGPFVRFARLASRSPHSKLKHFSLTHTFPQISAFDHYVSEGVIKSDPTEFREMSLKRRNFLEIQSRPKIGSFVRNRIHAVCLSSWHIQLCKYLGHCDRELFPTGLYLFRWKFSLLECWSHFIIAISIYMHFPCTYLSNE